MLCARPLTVYYVGHRAKGRTLLSFHDVVGMAADYKPLILPSSR